MLKQFLCDEDGQAVSEYGLVLGIVVVAVVAVLVAMKDQIVAMFNKVIQALSLDSAADA